jgi:hypothetical protein
VTPKRIQMHRTKGWRKPEGAVYVGRPTRWGNPYVVGTGEIRAQGPLFGAGAGYYDTDDERWYDVLLPGQRGLTADLAVALYRQDLANTFNDGHPDFDELREALGDLAGKDLACWCPLDQPCHADVLLALANMEEAEPL